MRVRDVLVGVTLGAVLVGGASSLGQRTEAPPPAAPVDPPLPIPESLPPTRPESDAAPAPPDPMQEVEDFVAQGREQAEAKVKALTAEAEALRSRLAKVDGATARWQAIAKALEAPAAHGVGADAPKPAGDLAPNEPQLAPAALTEPPR